MNPIQFGGAYVYHKTLSPQALKKMPSHDEFGMIKFEIDDLINKAISTKIGLSEDGQPKDSYTLIFYDNSSDKDSKNIVIDSGNGSPIEQSRKGLGPLGDEGHALSVHFIDDGQGTDEDVKNPVKIVKQEYLDTLGSIEVMPKTMNILQHITPVNITVTDFDLEKGTFELTGDHPRLRGTA